MQDVRELIPDLYCNPEVYLNLDMYDFGVMQNGVRIHDVVLPKWSGGNPYKFIQIMRKSLESNNIS